MPPREAGGGGSRPPATSRRLERPSRPVARPTTSDASALRAGSATESEQPEQLALVLLDVVDLKIPGALPPVVLERMQRLAGYLAGVVDGSLASDLIPAVAGELRITARLLAPGLATEARRG